MLLSTFEESIQYRKFFGNRLLMRVSEKESKCCMQAFHDIRTANILSVMPTETPREASKCEEGVN